MLSLPELKEWCKSEHQPQFRSLQIYDWLWKKGVRSFDAMTDLPAELRNTLNKGFALTPLILKDKLISQDGTAKYSFLLPDGKIIESVIIPAESRTTACISTQAGCPLACRFCATGELGFARDLTAAEIFDQFMMLNGESITIFGHPLDNIVYMGMGEPLLNYAQTLGSIAHLTDQKHGPGISPQRITVSTAGITDKIRRLGDDRAKIQLAVSLHTANQEKRAELMPVAKKHTLAELSESLKYYHGLTKSRITIEYLLLSEVNDGIKDARELASFCLDFPVKINIIEYNEVKGIHFKRASAESTNAFRKFLEDRNLIVNMRQSRGQDIFAACGQLAGKTLN
jgi:23S rRNA (adenine2503-C2)-methyltransferase